MTARNAGARNWVVAGGGTGGHVTPLLALAEQIEARGDTVRVLGSARGLETRMVPSAGFELVTLPSQPVTGRSLAERAASLPRMLQACAAAWSALGSFRTDVVVSVGGYASVPAVVAAVLRGVPLALVEPNAIPGRANRLAARFARRVAPWPGSIDFLATWATCLRWPKRRRTCEPSVVILRYYCRRISSRSSTWPIGCPGR